LVRERILNLIKYLFIAFSFFILIMMLLSTLSFVFKGISVVLSVISIFITVLLLGVSSFFAIRINRKKQSLYLILISSISFLLCVIWNIYAKTQPISDYKALLEGGYQIALGIFKDDKTSYYYMYNHQLGYAVYLSILMRFFGVNLLVFKMIDVMYIMLSVVLIYAITLKLFNKDTAAVASLFYSIFIFDITGSSIINNQHLSGVLLLAAILLILIDKYWSVSLSAVLLGLMNIARPLGIVLIIAIFIYFLYKILLTSNWKEWISKFVLVLISYYLVIYSFDAVLINSNITSKPVSKSNIPYFKFVIGLSDNCRSLYGNQDENERKTAVYYDLKSLNFNYEKYNDECKKFIMSHIYDYKSTLRIIYNKMTFFMGQIDHQYSFALNANQISSIQVFLNFGHFQYLIFIILALLSFIIRKRQKNNAFTIINVLFVGFILVHIFVEAQTRYRYETYFFLIIMSADFICYVNNRLENNFHIFFDSSNVHH
jgi:hypothetical protein